MTAREIKEKMSKTPWVVNTRAHLLIKNQETAIAAFGVRTSNVEDLIPPQTANMEAVLSAINNTYGANYDPEKTREFMEAFQSFAEKTKLSSYPAAWKQLIEIFEQAKIK